MATPYPWLNPIYAPPDTVADGTIAGVWRCGPASESQDVPRLYKSSGDVRQFAFDLGDIEEIVAGETITEASVDCVGLTIGTPVALPYRVAALFSSGISGTEYTVLLTATLSGGGAISRSGILKVT